MSKILVGGHIRSFELARNLGAPLIHGGNFARLFKGMKYAPLLLRTDKILIFNYYPLPYDSFVFSSLRKNCNFIFDVADIPHMQQTCFDPEKDNNKKIQKKFLWLINISNTLLFISPSLANLLSINLERKKRIFVPNASNPRFFLKKPMPAEKRKVILYVGGYSPMRGVDLLIEAFNLLRKKRKNAILKLISFNAPHNLGKNGIVVKRNQFYSDMPRVYSESHVCVIPHKKNPYMDAALPIKLFEAMAAARPLIVTNCYEMGKIVRNEKCGLVTEENARSLAESIDYLLSNDSLSQEMGEKGREAIEKRHSWRHRAQEIMKNIK